MYSVVIKDEYKKSAKDVMGELKEYRIGTRPFFYPMHKQPVFNKMQLFLNENLPVSENLYKKGFYIPSGVALTEKQIIEVSEAMHKVFS